MLEPKRHAGETMDESSSSQLPELNGIQEKILKLCGLGLSPTVVAGAVGVDPSYVTELLSEDTFAKKVSELRIAHFSEAADRDQKYDNAEDALLDRMEEMIPLMSRPTEIVRALAIVNNAKRRATPMELSANQSKPVVPLILPVIIQQHFVVNGQNQVIEVDGRSAATMPANAVMAKLVADRLGREHSAAVVDSKEATERLDTLDSIKRLSHLPVSQVL